MNRSAGGLGLPALVGVLLCIQIGGCAQPPKTVHGVSDPLEPVNRVVFDVNRVVHKVIVRPIVDVYAGVMPDPAEQGVRNFFRNAGYIHVIVNDLLQGELEHAWQDTQRMAINTTVGVGGIFDPATDMGLAYRRQNFGVTAARWGLPAGPYLVLPLVGPTTLRSTPDIPMRLVTNPVFYLDAGLTRAILSGAGAVDRAAAESDNLQRVEEAISPYALVREGYLARQMQLIGTADANAPLPPLPPELISDPNGPRHPNDPSDPNAPVE
jgi:phospholipid-binding lipoprotein MlaA